MPEASHAHPRKSLRVAYTVIALLAFAYTWMLNGTYFDEVRDFAGLGLREFLLDTQATEASTSISVDLMFFFLAASIFMVVESLRLDIRFVWAYIVGGIVIGISVTFPLFLVARELRRDPNTQTRLTRMDSYLLGLLTAASITVATVVTWC